MTVKKLSETERASLPGSFVRLRRGYVHYELSGPEDGPTIVLMPGLSVPYSTWDRTASVLASRGYRVLRYDHYGRGYSDRPRAAYDLELFVEQLAELLPALGLGESVFLVGLSMGGPVAAAAATMHPSLASGLALIDPLFEWPKPDLASRLALMPLLGEGIMALRGGAILAKGQRGDFSDEISYSEFIPSYMPPLRYRGVERAVLATMRSIPSWPLKRSFEALGRSGLPILLFWGRQDATLPFEQSARLLRCLPGAEFHVVEGAGHVPHWEKADEVNEVLLEFLDRVFSIDSV
ncbi:MAG: alpha/beta hydrolase [Rectinemataceae bacterium]|jgi:pimeloyl-ACP methyl ester carboxylesterase